MNTNIPSTETSSSDRWWLLWMLTTLVLCWPALWNGHPLFFYDSMDYIRSAFTLTPAHYRTLPYSLFLAGPEQMGTLWAVVLSQAAIGAYVLVELFRALLPPQRSPWLFLTCLPFLALGTGLPWFASQVMPDFFTGIMLAGLGLLLLAPLSSARRLALILITLTAISAHASHLPTALAVSLAGLFMAWRGVVAVKAGWVLGVVLLGILVTPISHYLATGEAYMSRNAPIMALARLIRDGEAQRYLREVCPQAGYRICDYQDQLFAGPNGANDFLWRRGSAFEQMGGWRAWGTIGLEARHILLGTWLAHPGSNLRAALGNWLEQLVRFGTGSGMGQDIWHAAPLGDVVRHYFPNEIARQTAARQYVEDLRLKGLSLVHQTTIGLAMALGLILALRNWGQSTPASRFFWLLVLATLANAAVTGIVSNPDDRYQARLVWLFVPALWFLWSARRRDMQ